jgi:hypothetical protein
MLLGCLVYALAGDDCRFLHTPTLCSKIIILSARFGRQVMYI